MPKLPVVKPKKLIKALKAAGFRIDHISGSHYVLYNDTKNLRTTVAYHNKPLKRKTLSSILKQANLSAEDLRKLL